MSSKRQQDDFDVQVKRMPYQLSRLELIEIWEVFCKTHQCRIKGKLTIIEIIRTNYAYLTTRQKKQYPSLLFKQKNSGESYAKKDALEWVYSLAIHLSRNGKLIDLAGNEA